MSTGPEKVQQKLQLSSLVLVSMWLIRIKTDCATLPLGFLYGARLDLASAVSWGLRRRAGRLRSGLEDYSTKELYVAEALRSIAFGTNVPVRAAFFFDSVLAKPRAATTVGVTARIGLFGCAIPVPSGQNSGSASIASSVGLVVGRPAWGRPLDELHS